jgi:hypothetical protein
MDSVFRKCKSIFTIVKIAKEEPRRFGKNGEVLINYDETEEHFRRASIISERRASMAASQHGGKAVTQHMERDEEKDGYSHGENGYARGR